FQDITAAGQYLSAETDIALGATGFDPRAAQSGDLDVAVGDAGANRPGQVCDHDRASIREQIDAARSWNGDFEIDPSTPRHFDLALPMGVLGAVSFPRPAALSGGDHDLGGIGAGRHLDRTGLVHDLEFATFGRHGEGPTKSLSAGPRRRCG